MRRFMQKNQFIWLTFSLVGLMLTGAFSRDVSENWTLELIEYTSVVLLLVSLSSLQTKRRWGKSFVVILGIMLAVIVIRGATKIEYFEYTYLTLMLAFMLLAAWLVAGQVLLTGEVDLNIIVGSIALYLLIGFIWSIFYTLLLEFMPDALKGVEVGMWYDNMPTTTYFSFVTLTTLGYGDISPARPLAEILVVLEAVTGMFYLAVIVASLIGAMRGRK
jgi:hypothetical protein